MITEDELAEYEALVNAATPGPWFTETSRPDIGDDGIWAVSADNPYHTVEQQIADGYGMTMVCDIVSGTGADRAFIAAARQAMTKLLAEVRRLQQVVNRAFIEAADPPYAGTDTAYKAHEDRYRRWLHEVEQTAQGEILIEQEMARMRVQHE